MAIHFSQITRKRSWNVKNEKCIAVYFASLFSRPFFGFSLYFAPKVKKHSRNAKHDGLVIHLLRNNMKMITKCKKWKVYSELFCVTFFAFYATFFAFHILQHFAPGSAFVRKVKGFRGLFSTVLIKHEICMKYEKYIVSVSYFVVCFSKTFVKYLGNVKYKKCMARYKFITDHGDLLFSWEYT